MLAHTGHVMTLANSIIGVGILAMPFCFQKCGIVLSIVLLVLSNWVTRVCCHYLIKSSLLTRRKSFEMLGFHSFSASGKLIVELCIIGYLLGTCITYFVVVGDLGPQIVTKMFSLQADGHVHLRPMVMIAVTLFCILPLGMLKNVDSLSTVCTASIGFYVCLVLKIVLESEEHIVANDWSEQVLYWRPAGILQCLPIFSMALSCQMQLFEVFESINNQSLEKLNGIVRNAAWICTFVYIAVGFFGYVAFCTQSFSGNILMNFSPSFGSDVIRIGFVLSVAFSFPLVIFPCRASIYSLLYRKGHADATGYIPEARFKAITVVIVTIALCVALLIPSVELVIGLVGSTIGVAICVMFPAACFRRIVKKDTTERSLAQFIFIGGFCLMILGTYANLSAIDEKRSGAHLDDGAIEAPRLLHPPTKLPLMATEEGLKALEANMKRAERVFRKEQEAFKKEKLPKASPPSQPAAPPLPVDEKHEPEDPKLSEKQEKQIELPQEPPPKPMAVEKSIKDGESGGVLQNISLQTGKMAASAMPPKEVLKQEDTVPSPPFKPARSIDKDAIQKDDEIAAEESKAKTNVEELQRTQIELKKTKELLERKVDELKEELAKKNQETQDLVVEKLGEVVEKVEQIERKVQRQESSSKTNETLAKGDQKLVATPMEQPKQLDGNGEDRKSADRKNKGLLLSVLSESEKERKEDLAPKKVYEPLSYKTGELVGKVKNSTKMDQRLPLPLALLINASRTDAKEAEALNGSLNDVQEKLLEEERRNVANLRRDILQVNPKVEDALRTEAAAASLPPRVKRETDAETLPHFEDINRRLEMVNDLSAPKLEALLDFQAVQSIGRDLKSVPEDEVDKD